MTRQLYTPYDYQRRASRFLLDHNRCNLWAGMGLGKTSIVLTYLDILKMCGSSFFPALVIAPKRVAQSVWYQEAEKWDAFRDLSVIRMLGDKGRRTDALSRAWTHDVAVINYDNLQWLIAQAGGKWPFKIVIADEATRLKNFRLSGGGVRAAALAKVARLTGRWVNMTGTPATNGLKDLWGQNWFVDFGERLGRTWTQFLQTWFFVNEYTHEIRPVPGADKEIEQRLADITMALRFEDCFPGKLHEPIQRTVECEMDDTARKLYERMETEFFAEIGDGEIDAFNAGVLSMKLLQMATGAVFDNEHDWHEVHDAKLDALEDIVEETGENLLVAYHFTFDVPRIKARFPHARVLESERDINDWNAGRVKMLLIHPQSAGHGLSLQHGGRTVVFFTHTWDLELRLQVIERIGPARQVQSGYDRAVLVYDIVTKDTLEPDVLQVLESKLSIQEALMLARSRR